MRQENNGLARNPAKTTGFRWIPVATVILRSNCRYRNPRGRQNKHLNGQWIPIAAQDSGELVYLWYCYRNPIGASARAMDGEQAPSPGCVAQRSRGRQGSISILRVRISGLRAGTPHRPVRTPDWRQGRPHPILRCRTLHRPQVLVSVPAVLRPPRPEPVPTPALCVGIPLGEQDAPVSGHGLDRLPCHISLRFPRRLAPRSLVPPRMAGRFQDAHAGPVIRTGYHLHRHLNRDRARPPTP